MGLNLSNQQIAQELDLDKDVVQEMTIQLRQGTVSKKPPVNLSDEVECNEVYVTAGHKGNPEAVRKRGVKDGATASKGFRAYSRCAALRCSFATFTPLAPNCATSTTRQCCNKASTFAQNVL